MKKRVYGKKLGRGGGARKALLRGLAVSLVEHGRVRTTKTKAKYLQGFIEPLVTVAKVSSVASVRRVYAQLGNNKKATKDLFDKIAVVFKGRAGGYTRIIPLPERCGDSAKMAMIEWVVKPEGKQVSKAGQFVKKGDKNENVSTKRKSDK